MIKREILNAEYKKQFVLISTPFLNEIKSLASESYVKINMTNLCKKYNLQYSIIESLLQLNILKRIGSHIKTVYFWKSPNIINDELCNKIWDKMADNQRIKKANNNLANHRELSIKKNNLVPISNSERLKNKSLSVDILRALNSIHLISSNDNYVTMETILSHIELEMPEHKELSDEIYRILIVDKYLKPGKFTNLLFSWNKNGIPTEQDSILIANRLSKIINKNSSHNNVIKTIDEMSITKSETNSIELKLKELKEQKSIKEKELSILNEAIENGEMILKMEETKNSFMSQHSKIMKGNSFSNIEIISKEKSHSSSNKSKASSKEILNFINSKSHKVHFSELLEHFVPAELRNNQKEYKNLHNKVWNLSNSNKIKKGATGFYLSLTI